METIELNYESWVQSMKDTFTAGAEAKLADIITALNNDAVLTMNVDASFLGYLVGVIENA